MAEYGVTLAEISMILWETRRKKSILRGFFFVTGRSGRILNFSGRRKSLIYIDNLYILYKKDALPDFFC